MFALCATAVAICPSWLIAGSIDWVRAARSPPRSPELIELEIELPLEVELAISSCEALNWFGTVLNAYVLLSSTSGCPLPT